MRSPGEQPRRRSYTGPALFSFGFRPFFLGGAVFAAAAVVVWLAAYAGGGNTIGPLNAVSWHTHEMIFGFFAAIAAGFLLTAIPNWTGRLPVTGPGLAALFGLWLGGRAAMVMPMIEPWLAGVLDSLFLLMFAALVWREIMAGRNRRNLPVCVLITLLAGANVAFHVFAEDPQLLQMIQRAALAVPALLIALIGGRIVPSFTRNWLAQRSETRLPAPAGWYDKAALGIAGLALAAWVAAPYQAVTGYLLVLAGGVHAIRMMRWRGHRTSSEPLVWVLHMGYGSLAVALILMGLSILVPHAVPASAALHALTAGAMGIMILAVMTRATLGHTGRERTADSWTITIYLLAIGGAVLRVSSGFVPTLYMPLLVLSGVLWAGAFALFVICYGPLLVRRR